MDVAGRNQALQRLTCRADPATGTLRERVKVAGKDTETVINALIKNTRKLPQELYKSLTRDRGKEMADHKRFTLATHMQVYFRDPHNPWQRGRMKIPMGGCASISRKAWIVPLTGGETQRHKL